MVLPIKLNPDLDPSAAAHGFAEQGYAAVNDVLVKPDARRLYKAASEWVEWNLVALIDGQHRDFIGAEMDRLEPARRAPFDQLVWREAQSGFGYLFENVPLYDAGMRDRLTQPLFKAAFELTRSEAFIALGRKLTGDDAITFADCQLTRYRPGHFLTRHDDGVEGKNRSAAFVLNLTPDWCADYGGVLNLLDEQGDVRAGLTPAFNRLTLFKVPQPHLVSVISPFARGARFAITGWFRRGEEPLLQG
ncbi:2OG-Fe(II) oxygenase family protein [Oceanicaulis sp. MMSF_3324]|uniref:2OG-Fe(II) oxygenase n=1 Tax=Oceanicaulis sp. MMSF_3324 TaxID=3046702 RepID=UPI00273D04D3|nr:2OG-Fe(II) oxygenase family protein [Oceanicaulis sp. MMSF_3324]